MSNLPINPEVMRWARETAGMSIGDVVGKVNRKGVSAETVAAWEEGVKSPTYPQLERLAYEIYKRPLAIFFFPQPPEESTPEQSFRTLPKSEIELLSSDMRFLLRKAAALQLNLVELYDGSNPAERQIVKDIDLDSDISAAEMSQRVRDYLSVDLDAQINLKDSEQAMKFWREVLEDFGVSVFKDAFKDNTVSGFCLYDDEFPLIYVNNSTSFNRQIFTLFHELAHLLFETGGVDIDREGRLDSFEIDDRLIEILCNEFAAEFLVPSDDFDARIHGMSIGDQEIFDLADRYHVSQEVILRRFLDRGAMTKREYQERVLAWSQSARSGRSGGNYYANMSTYLGDRYVERAFSQYYQNRFGIDRLAEYLGVKAKNVPGMENVAHQDC